LSKGIALNTATSIAFKDLIDEIVLRGLKTLSDLREEIFTPESPPSTYGKYAVLTITKSRIFQGSLK
jgi:hypothetical protein